MELQISRKNILKPEIDQHNADWDVNMNHQLLILNQILNQFIRLFLLTYSKFILFFFSILHFGKHTLNISS